MGDSYKSKSHNPTVHLDPKQFRFSVFSTDEVLRLSVSKIVTPFTFDELGNPLPGGLYDSAMGIYPGSGNPCATCLSMTQCPGHIGHIQLCMTVYNPMFIQTVFKILRMSCLKCFKLQISDYRISILDLQLKLIDAGFIIEAEELEAIKFESVGSEAEGMTIPANERITEYTKLIDEGACNSIQKTKNSEAARIAIINSTLVDPKKTACIHCKDKIKKIKYSYKRIVMTYSKDDMQRYYEETGQDFPGEKKSRSANKVVLASECRKYLRKLYANEPELLKYLFPVLKYSSPTADCPVDLFFTDVVPVTPPLVRPANKVAHRILEHVQTTMYKNILNANTTLRAIVVKLKQKEAEELGVEDLQADESMQVLAETKAVFDSTKGDTPHEKMYNAWQELQRFVDASLDQPADKTNPGVGLKQILEKKEGIIRMNMMGKRVNHAARTVITPDPNINVDEIGVPDVFAKKLSYPTPVTPWNISEVRKMVLNGPNVHPGANFIEDARGNRRIIPGDDEVKRAAMAKLLTPPNENGATTVHRHLLNGDVLLLNRQPTLHRPSIMAHKARILAGEKTFRLHYSNCKSYNADFDGDEMNAHFPQNEVGRSEAYNLVNVANQYLVPKDGTPLGGLIQDHVISGVRLSIRGKFFNKEDYQQLVYVALADKSGNIELLPPTILKPFKLWSGKQVLSTIIRNIIPKGVDNINLTSTSKINAKAWQVNPPRSAEAGGTPLVGNDMTEADVIIRNGELLVGILDKNHYGAAQYSLIHCMYELYGGDCSTHLLTAFAKLFTVYLQRQGFTLGVRDILVVPSAEKKRTKLIKKCRKIGHATAAAALGLPEDVSADELAEKTEEAYATNPKFRTILDRTFKSALDGFTNKINKVCLPSGLLCKFPENNLQLMVTSGAKGSTVNTMQISCLLGQIELEGKRPPLMISGKSLPSFATFETSPKSGGFIDGRFMTGIQPQDFFFHCMAGREGLIDTAVKTSRSGYLQRCLIKHLEGLNVSYDMTVRDSDGTVVQFMYGEDGTDIEKSQFLKTKQLRFIDENTKAILNDSVLARLKDDVKERKIESHMKKLRTWRKKYVDPSKTRHTSSFAQFSREIKDEIEVNDPNKLSKKTGRLRIDQKIIKLWNKADNEMKERYNKKFSKCPDPVTSKFRPDTHYGSVSEYTQSLIASYVKDNPTSKRDITEAIYMKSMNALIEPGAPVGLLAAQSIGEPSTQMTLNTFHFAGRGEMNVTLGIPRLREILMMAAINIKTPSMDIPFKSQPNLEVNAEKLRLKLTKTTIGDVLESVNVKTKLVLLPKRARQYVLRFNFLPRVAYKNQFPVTPKQILKYMSKTFFKNMFRAIARAGKDKHSIVDIDEPTNKKRKAGGGDDMEDEADRKADEKEIEVPLNNDESDNEAADDEDDATDVRLKNKRLDENEYDEPQLEEEVKENDDDDLTDENEIDPLADKDDDELVDQEDVNKVVAEYDLAENYIYDKENHQWCELTFNLDMMLKNIDLSTVLKQLATKAVIVEVPHINRAITYMNNDELVLKTEGINIAEMFKYNKILDLHRLYTNDIHAVARTYGIEAANRVIVKEVQNVFKVYGITVDPRHLVLISDYMTLDGTIKPMNRFGMQTNASPLQQMSFESSLVFLKLAAIHGLTDDLDSPSSRIMVGMPCRGGTGAFSLLHHRKEDQEIGVTK